MREPAARFGQHQHQDYDFPSNERLLRTAFVTFMTFALTQLVFAVVAGSEAMMGDSAAMIVDAITYLFNWFAERRKSQSDEFQDMGLKNDVDPRKAARIRGRNKRKRVLQLEILPPTISVVTLAIVTFFVTKKAVGILQLDMHRSRDEQRLPNINLMLAFSIVNLALDGLNVFCFARAKHLLGYTTLENDMGAMEDTLEDPMESTEARLNGHVDGNDENRDEAVTPNRRNQGYNQVPVDNSTCPSQEVGGVDVIGVEVNADFSVNRQVRGDALRGDDMNAIVGSSRNGGRDHHYNERNHANLNMCSAYTHVFADTLRSVAVIIAAGLAEVLPEVTPEVADSTAAVVVSFLILLTLIPLIQGLFSSIAELRAILAEELSEAMARRPQSTNFEIV